MVIDFFFFLITINVQKMIFENIEQSHILIIIPAVLVGLWMIWRSYFLSKNFTKKSIFRLRNYEYSQYLFCAKYVLLLLCFIFLTISILRPQWGTKTSKVGIQGVDIIFTLDVSQSMKAQDLSDGRQYADRLSGAKFMIRNFVNSQPQNRFGLVIFAGEAFVSTPLTFDHSAFLTFLEGVDSDDVSTQGTNLGEALNASLDRFKVQNNDEEPRGKAIVLISDGGEELDDVAKSFSKLAKEEGIKIITIGIGSNKGVPIPEGRDVFGRVSYKKYKGQIVLTELNEDTLKRIASMTDSEYFHAGKADDLQLITSELEDLQKTTLEKEVSSMKEDRYQWFLMGSFLFFLGWLVIQKRKKT